MASSRGAVGALLRAGAWVILGVGLVVFYTTYVTVNTYYSPVGTAILILLGSTIVALGLIEPHVKRRESGRDVAGPDRFISLGLIPRIQREFWKFFAAAMTLTAADVLLTLYAISKFGLSLERNRVVAQLLSAGDVYTWLGQQFAPLVIVGVLFALVKRSHPRTAIAFYVIGTAVYAAGVVVNNTMVLLRVAL